MEFPNAPGSFVHHSAKVDPGAALSRGVIIGPNVVIEAGVWIGAYSVIGDGPPEHSEYFDDLNNERTFGVHIKKGARIFQHATIHAGIERPTMIGEGACVMRHCHVAHDCTVERGAIISGGSSLAGYVWVMTKAIVGAHSIVHQHCVIGAYAFLGMGSGLHAHVPPGEKWLGFPARRMGFNDVGLMRAGMTLNGCVALHFGMFEHLSEVSKLK